MSPYRHVPHPRIHHRKAARAVKVADQFARTSAIDRFNTAFALKITAAVGSMWCAYIFAALALFGLPSAIHAGTGGVVQWIAQTFLQLVLLSIIIVGQNVQAAAADRGIEMPALRLEEAAKVLPGQFPWPKASAARGFPGGEWQVGACQSRPQADTGHGGAAAV